MTDSNVISYEAKVHRQYLKQLKGSRAYRAKRSHLKGRKSVWELTCLGVTAAVALSLCDEDYPEPIGIRSAWDSARGIVKLPIAQRFDLLLETRDAELSDQDIRFYLQDCVEALKKRLVPTRRK